VSRRIWDSLLAAALACCLWVVWHNRHGGALREASRLAAQWKPGVKVPSQAQLASLPARAQWQVDAQCYREAGGAFPVRNCYAEAASLMLLDARDQERARDMAYLGLLLLSLLGGLTVAARLRKRSEFSA
jgi:hypothetical protein